MTLAEAAQNFLAQNRIAVVGVSRRRGHAANFIFNKLRATGHDVVPVNRGATEVEGAHCYPDLKSIPGGVSAALIVTRPSEAATVVRECAELGITRVWLHRSIGAGSASDEAVQVGRDAKLALIRAGCPMMFAEPVDLPHKCLRWCLRVTGRLPATIGGS
ncbi:MAG: CoA-binding protein [Opitutaceae bacterium]|nr:CoA-binding protein [Opitutaceae bacterium]